MATIAKTHGDLNTTGASTITFSAQNIGADGGSDVLYFAIGSRNTTAATLNSVSVDGEAASLVIGRLESDGGAITSIATIYAIERNSLPDPSQTDVDVEITFSSTQLRTAMSTFLSPDASVTAEDTATAAGTGTGPFTLDCDTTAGAVGLGVLFVGDDYNPYTWVGLTKIDDDDLPGPNNYTSAAESNLSAGTPTTINVSSTTSGSGNKVAVAAVFPDASAPPGTIEFADSDTWVVGASDTATYTLTLPTVFGGDESIYVAAGAISVAGLLGSVAIEIDGEPIPKIKEVTTDLGNNISFVSGIYAIKRDDLPTPGATSITLTTQYGVTLLRAAASIYVGQATRVDGFYDDAFATTGDNGTLSVSLGLDIPVGGIAIGAIYATTGAGAPTASWTGLVEDTDLLLAAGPNVWSSASLESLAGAEPQAVTVATSIAGSLAGLAVSFGLEGGGDVQVGPDLLEFRGERVSTTGGTSASFLLPIGPREGGNEAIYVTIGSRSISGFPTISSLTFDGVEGTILTLPVNSSVAGGGFTAVTTCYAYGIRRQDLPDPLVENVTVAVTYTVSSLRSAACVWVGQDLDLQPLGVGADTAGSVTETLETSISIPNLGATIAFYYSGDGMSSGGFTWTGIEENTSIETTGPNSFSGAMELIGAEGALRTITATKLGVVEGALIAFSVLQRIPDVIIPPGAPAIPFELFYRQGAPNQIPLQGDSWEAGDPFDEEDDGPTRDPIQPGVNSPKIRGIGWRRAMWRLRQAKGMI